MTLTHSATTKQAFPIWKTVRIGGVDTDLVIGSVAELGFKDTARYDEFCTRALDLGLELCPAEIEPALLPACQDQPRGKCLFVASDPNVFIVGHEGEDLVITSERAHPWKGVHLDNRWIFVQRR